MLVFMQSICHCRILILGSLAFVNSKKDRPDCVTVVAMCGSVIQNRSAMRRLSPDLQIYQSYVRLCSGCNGALVSMAAAPILTRAALALTKLMILTAVLGSRYILTTKRLNVYHAVIDDVGSARQALTRKHAIML